MIVVTTEKSGSMIDDYVKIWGIATLFGNLKSRGFDLESIHMKNIDRMYKLMGLDCCCVVLTSGALVLWECKLIITEHYHPQESVQIRVG
ncbi:MAG: hypothetical protein QS721_08810 [Candidatus Endonucleobacter sp. (ex Gigantidas childressi)]|nr:hypothetical protein [Candidatus Endonucleobacter sp. (ex Gigantidas childressi)]